MNPMLSTTCTVNEDVIQSAITMKWTSEATYGHDGVVVEDGSSRITEALSIKERACADLAQIVTLRQME